MGAQIIGAILASVLYVIVFQKAGFRGAMLVLAGLPILSAIVVQIAIRAMMAGQDWLSFALPFMTIPLSLAPLAALAFVAWPPAATPVDFTEN